MNIMTLRAFADNYIFLLVNDSPAETVVVDPGDAAPVLDYLRQTERCLCAIFITHHHKDHVGGNRALVKRFPGIPVFGCAGDRGRIPCQTDFLADGDEIVVCGVRAKILEVPGHTRGHIAYFIGDRASGEGDLFSGDTVFGGTIGNLFEGTPDEMFRSIGKIRELPPQTRIWCAHEYTLQYVRESAAVDPGNERLARRLKTLQAAATHGRPTVPLSLEEECATNPFFRWDDPRLVAQLATTPGMETFRRLCEIT